MNFEKDEVIGNDANLEWNELVTQVQKMEPKGSQWIFRALTGWEDKTGDPSPVPIRSSFDDAWKRRTAPTKLGDRKLYESWILADFKREAHNYLSHLPEPDNFLEWMALGRHFGMPSRLTDFTYSFHVAAYFALSMRKKCEHGRMVALNLTWLKDDWERRLASHYPGFKGRTGSFHSNELFKEFAFTRCDQYAVVVNPLRRNPRLANQKGCFLCPGNIEQDTDENLNHTVGGIANVKKMICLRSEIKTVAMQDLFNMNITQATLYPDLSGWAESRRDLVHREISDDRFREELEVAINDPRI